MHFVVSIQECEGYNAMWAIVDRCPMMGHFIPCQTTVDAVGLAELFIWEVIPLPELPVTILLDCGQQFGSTI